MLCEAEVTELEVAGVVEQQVFGLEVPVQNVVGVQVLEDQHDAVQQKVLRECVCGRGEHVEDGNWGIWNLAA